MKKISESYSIQYQPTSINHIRSSLSIEATEIKDGISSVEIFVRNYQGKRSVDYCQIKAQDFNDLLEKCDTYCTGLVGLVEMIIA